MPDTIIQIRIKDYFNQMSSEDLIEIISLKQNEYQQSAIDIINLILLQRGYSSEQLVDFKNGYKALTNAIKIVDDPVIDFKALGKFRDNIILILAINYGIGYAGWSVYAMIYSLGNIPAFDIQYILTGLAPSLILYIVFIYIKRRKYISNYIDLNFNRKVKGARLIIRKIIYWGWLGVLAVPLVYLNLIKNNEIFIYIFIGTIVAINILSFTFRPVDCYYLPKRKLEINKLLKSVRLLRRVNIWGRNFFQSYLLFTFCILVLPLFYFLIFPNIPQEIGGVKTKVAILISDKNIFSINTPKETKLSNQYRDTLKIYFYNNTLIVGKKNDTTYEINRSNVQSLIWLKDDFFEEKEQKELDSLNRKPTPKH